MNRRCDVSEGCVAAGTTGVSEMLLAVLEPYAGKLARTVLRGPRFRKDSGLGKTRRVVERTISWLHNFRRLRIRFERLAFIHEAFMKIACCISCWRKLNSFC